MAELKEDDLLPNEVSPDDLEPEAPTSTLTEHDGVKRLELHKVAQALPDEDPPPAPEKNIQDATMEKLAPYLDPKSASGAFALGSVKGSTLGTADELYGLLEAARQVDERNAKQMEDVDDAKARGTYDPSAAAPKIPGVTSYTLKRPGMPDQSVVRAAKTSPDEPIVNEQVDVKKAYQGARNAVRDDYVTAEKGHGGAFAGGEFLGGMAVPVPGAGKAKGLAKIGKYVAGGALLGAASGLGNSDEDLTEGHVGGSAWDTLKGGAVGGVVGGVLGYGASKLDPWLEKKAAEKAYKALDPYMKTISEGLGPDVASGKVPASAAKEEMRRLGQRALDEKIIPEGPVERFADPEAINDRAVSKLNEAGQMLGGHVDRAQDELAKLGQATPVSLGRLATQIEQSAEQAKLEGKQELARKLLRQARDIRQTVVDRAAAGFNDPAAQTLQDAEKFKTGLQGQIDYGAPLARREAQTAVARLAKEQAEKAIEGGLGPDELEQFKALKDRYGDLATIAKTSGHGAIRSFRNQSMGLGDKIAAEVGASAASSAGTPEALATGAAAGLAHHVANHRGSAALARTLSNMSKRVSPLLAPAVERATEGDEEKLDPWSLLRGRQ